MTKGVAAMLTQQDRNYNSIVSVHQHKKKRIINENFVRLINI